MARKILFSILALLYLVQPAYVYAQTQGGLDDLFTKSTTEIYEETSDADYNAENIMMTYVVKWVYALIMPLLGSVAVLAIIISGFQLMMSQGADSSKDAVDRLLGAILGLILIMLTAVILHEVNPYYFSFGP